MKLDGTEKVISSTNSSEAVYHTGQGPEPLVVKSDTKTSSPTSRDEKHVPHYLRSSAGSCHDLCKYGRKHTSEANARRPLFYPVLGNKAIHGGVRDRVKIRTLAKMRKKPASKDEPLSNDANANKSKRPSKTVGLMEIKGRSCELLSLPNQEEGLYEEPVSSGLSSTPSSSDRAVVSFSSSPSEIRKHSYEYPSSMDDMTVTPLSPQMTIESSENMQQVHSEKFVKELISEDQIDLERRAHGALVEDPEAAKEEIFSVVEEIDAAASSVKRPICVAEESTTEQVNMAVKFPVPAPTRTGNRGVKRSMSKPKSVAEVGKQKGTNASSKPDLVSRNAVKRNSRSPTEKAGTSFKPKLIKQKNLSFKKTAPEMMAAARILKPKSPSPSKASITSISLQPKSPALRPSSSLLKPPNDPPVRRVRARGNIIAETASISTVRKMAMLKSPKASPKTSVGGVPSAMLWKYGGPKPALSPHKNRAKLELDGGKAKERRRASSEPSYLSSLRTPPWSNSNVARRKKDEHEGIERHLRGGGTNPALPPRKNRAKPEVDGGGKAKERRRASLEPSYSSSFRTPPRTNSNVARRKKDEREGIERHVIRDGFPNCDNDRTRGVGLEDASSTPQKLKFRRGKVVVPEVDNNNNGPKRLRFRQSRVVAMEKQPGKEFCGRRISRTTRRRRESVGEDGLAAKPEAPTVVLKHQGQLEKKHTPGLFNQVIEETASKLLETRKSNVKALVGAFETVISLL